MYGRGVFVSGEIDRKLDVKTLQSINKQLFEKKTIIQHSLTMLDEKIAQRSLNHGEIRPLQLKIDDGTKLLH